MKLTRVLWIVACGVVALLAVGIYVAVQVIVLTSPPATKAVHSPHSERQESGAAGPPLAETLPGSDAAAPYVLPSETDAPVDRAPAAVEPVDPMSTVDQILETLEFGDIVFNPPSRMNVHDTVVVRLLLGVHMEPAELQEMFDLRGELEAARIRISDRMQARLGGPDFDVTAVTPTVQAISRREPTEWKWEVSPLREGSHRLHLTVSALISVDGSSTPRPVQTYARTIHVEVRWHQRASEFVSGNWQWLWTALAVPVLGWWWRRRRKRRLRPE